MLWALTLIPSFRNGPACFRESAAARASVYGPRPPPPRQVVRFQTTMGDFDMVLNPTNNPRLQEHVDNMLLYVEEDRYQGIWINRAAENFVLQMGSFYSQIRSAVADVESVRPMDRSPRSTGVPAVHQRSFEHDGTVSLALPGLPTGGTNRNGGTSSFFVNLASNTFLDADFTVFAAIPDLTVINQIMGLTQLDRTTDPLFGADPGNLAFIDVPVQEDGFQVFIRRAFVVSRYAGDRSCPAWRADRRLTFRPRRLTAKWIRSWQPPQSLAFTSTASISASARRPSPRLRWPRCRSPERVACGGGTCGGRGDGEAASAGVVSRACLAAAANMPRRGGEAASSRVLVCVTRMRLVEYSDVCRRWLNFVVPDRHRLWVAVCHSTPSIRQLMPEPMPSMATRSPGVSRPCSMPSAIVIGKATEPVLPRVSTVAKSISGSSPSVSNSSWRWAMPTWWQNVRSMSSRSQPVAARNSVERFGAGGHALPHQLFAVGLHERFEAAAVAQFVLARVAADHRRREAIAGLAQLLVAQHDRDAGGADGERGHGVLHVSRVSDSSLFSCAIVFSTSARPHSVPTTTPARIWPSSIMLATCTMPLSMPRQALETS